MLFLLLLVGTGVCQSFAMMLTKGFYTEDRLQQSIRIAKVSYKNASNESFLCFVVVKPGSYEIGLLEYAYANRKGIFECDEHLVVSNSSILQNLDAITAGRDDVNYALIDGDLEGNLVNGWANVSAIFRKAWHSVAKHILFENQAWVIKLDMDAVISASRLRNLLTAVPTETAESSSGVYIQNFPMHMNVPRAHLQGPLEILSKRAAEVLVLGDDICDNSETSEDWWLQKCILKLGITEVNGIRLGSLDGPLWNLWWGPIANLSNATDETCGQMKFAAFHPFKNVSSYAACADALEANLLLNPSSSDDAK